MDKYRYAVSILLRSAGTAFTTRIALFTIGKARPLGPIACFIPLSEAATAANPYSRIASSYSAIAVSTGFSPCAASVSFAHSRAASFSAIFAPIPRYGVML